MNDTNFLIKNGVDVNKSLEIFGDINTYNQTVGELVVSAKDKLAKLEVYKNSKDLSNYAIYAHSLTSDATYFGFTHLAELAGLHEQKCKGGDFYYIYNHYQELKDEVDRAVDVVNEYLHPGSVPAFQNIPVAPVAEAAPAAPAPAVAPVIPETPAAPAAPAIEAQAPAAAPLPANIPTGEVYNKKTILVVDDSNIIRNFVKRIFSDTYGVGTAKDGEEAIDILAANRENDNIVCMLLDLNMPKVDGFAVLEYMKENNLFSKFPVSIISGDSSKETIDKAFKYQIVDMLGKPFNESSIRSAVEKTIYYKEMM